MKQVVEERFKDKEPDVKIVDLEELKKEGLFFHLVSSIIFDLSYHGEL